MKPLLIVAFVAVLIVAIVSACREFASCGHGKWGQVPCDLAGIQD